jgi:O-antigen/teichoic acid export membrane protein
MLVFDPAFLAGSSVLVALGFAQLLNACTGPCGTVLIMSGHSDISLANTLALFGMSVGLDWLLIPPYGLGGAALAGLLAVVTINLLRVGEVWWLLRIHPFKWSFVKPIVAALLSVALVVGLRSLFQAETLVLDLAYALLLVVAYVAMIYLLKLDAEDALVINAVRGRILGLKPA